MKVLPGYRIRPFDWVESLSSPWKGPPEGPKFMDFVDGCSGDGKFFIRPFLRQCLLSFLHKECFLHVETYPHVIYHVNTKSG